MLKTRIITALILIPLVVWATIFLNNFWFGIILIPVILTGIWEWNQLFNYRHQFISIALTIAGFIFYSYFIVSQPLQTLSLNFLRLCCALVQRFSAVLGLWGNLLQEYFLFFGYLLFR